jgi:hypothetical protein
VRAPDHAYDSGGSIWQHTEDFQPGE